MAMIESWPIGARGSEPFRSDRMDQGDSRANMIRTVDFGSWGRRRIPVCWLINLIWVVQGRSDG
jgi:hypothetical protein